MSNLFTIDLVTDKRHPDEVLVDRARKQAHQAIQRYMVCADCDEPARKQDVVDALANFHFWVIKVGLDHALV